MADGSSEGPEAPDSQGGRPSGMDDCQLMERIQGGDRAAFGVLLGRYWVTLGQYSTGLIGSEGAAEEVVQEAFMRIWEHRSSWEPSGSVKSYLYQIVRNLSLNRKRDWELRRRLQEKRMGDLPGVSPPPTPSDVFAAEDLMRSADDAIQALSPRRREIFILARYHGLSYRDIAAAMDIAPQTVANHMSAALQELRKALEDHLGEDG